MNILNVRLGLATNSSSSHSLVFIPKGKAREMGHGPEYGWEMFQLTREASKLDYLAESLRQQVSSLMGDDIANAVVNDWCGVAHQPGYIDHQSALTFPRSWDGKGINREFFDDFKQFVMRDDIIIAGGNDNDDDIPPAVVRGGKRIGYESVMPVECYSEPWVARRDQGVWTIFNRNTGAKIRMSYDSLIDSSTPVARSSTPELVDLKITDYCPFECGYCYQGSTKEGKHGDTSVIHSIAFKLQDMQVFEVAIGGGEPTMHPDFVEILRIFRHCGVVPNFTTKSLAWLKDDKKREEIFDAVGAVAFSCESAADVNKLAAALAKHGVPSKGWEKGYRRIVVQHVVGVASPTEFKKVLEACAENQFYVTLLGYKDVGRGPSFGAKPNAKWLGIVKEVTDKRWLCVSIDTALADRHWDSLLAAGVNDRLVTRYEGQYSCYIDAVKKTMHVSSYDNSDGLSFDFQSDLGTLYRALPKPWDKSQNA